MLVLELLLEKGFLGKAVWEPCILHPFWGASPRTLILRSFCSEVHWTQCFQNSLLMEHLSCNNDQHMMKNTLEIHYRKSIFCMEFYKLTRECRMGQGEGFMWGSPWWHARETHALLAPRGTHLSDQPHSPTPALPLLQPNSVVLEVLTLFTLIQNQASEKRIDWGYFQPNIWSLFPFL